MKNTFLVFFLSFFLLAVFPVFGQQIQLRTAAVTCDTLAYAAGDLVGPKLSLTDPATTSPAVRGKIKHVTLIDLAAQAGDLEVVFFSADPSGTTFTNNAALDIADADLQNVIGVVPLTVDAAYVDNGVTQMTLVGVPQSMDLPFVLTSGTTLYAAVVARAARTQAATSDLTLKVYIESP